MRTAIFASASRVLHSLFKSHRAAAAVEQEEHNVIFQSIIPVLFMPSSLHLLWLIYAILNGFTWQLLLALE